MISPTISQPKRAVVAGLLIAFIAYFALLHVLIVRGAALPLALGLIVAPWIIASVSTLLAPRRAAPARMVAAVLVVALAVLLGWRYGERLATQVDLVLYIENLAFLLTLATLFATTLRGDRDALITRLARSVRKTPLPEPAVRYTRLVTIAWAVFFVAMALISTVLFATQSRTVWSSFVNLLILPLAAAMFALEYAIRIRVLRDLPHVSLMTGVQAFRQRGATPRIETHGEPR